MISHQTVTGILELNPSIVLLLELCASHSFLNNQYVQAEVCPSVTPGHPSLEVDNEICCIFFKQFPSGGELDEADR